MANQPRPIQVLSITTFGVDRRARYGLPDRKHRGGEPLHTQSVLQLFQEHRGTTIAARFAHSMQHEQDMKLALLKSQEIVAELVRRMLAPNVDAHIKHVDRDYLIDGDALADEPADG